MSGRRGEEQQLLRCYAASTKLRHTFGPQAGQPLELDQGEPPLPNNWGTVLCRSHSGFNLHADTVIEAVDRERLERLCRYIQRPTLAQVARRRPWPQPRHPRRRWRSCQHGLGYCLVRAQSPHVSEIRILVRLVTCPECEC